MVKHKLKTRFQKVSVLLWATFVCIIAEDVTLDPTDDIVDNNTTEGSQQEPRIQPQPSAIVNLTVTRITSSSAIFSWDVNTAVDLAGNVTQITVCVTDFIHKFTEKKNITGHNVTVYATELKLAYATRYLVCVTAWVNDDVMRPNDEICEEFVTNYDPQNGYALAALASVIMIAAFFIGCHALAFILNPGQPSSDTLKNQMLDVQEQRRASRKNFGEKKR